VKVTEGSIRGIHIALTMEEAAMLMGILGFPQWHAQPRAVQRFCAWLSEDLMRAAGTEWDDYPRTADALGMIPRTTVNDVDDFDDDFDDFDDFDDESDENETTA